MPEFTYTGGEDRYYPEQGVEATPGLVRAFDTAPDGLWVEVDPPKPAGKPKAPAEPASPDSATAEPNAEMKG